MCQRSIGSFDRLHSETRSSNRVNRVNGARADQENEWRIREETVDLAHGTKDVLAYVHGPGPWSRFRSAAMVGTGRHHPDYCRELVGGLSQRLVLIWVAVEFPSSGQRGGLLVDCYSITNASSD